MYVEIINGKINKIFDDVIRERIRQDEIHLPFKDNYEAMVVLTEEVGELAQAIYDHKTKKEVDNKHIYEEAIQIMAVCLKFLEKIDTVN